MGSKNRYKFIGYTFNMSPSQLLQPGPAHWRQQAASRLSSLVIYLPSLNAALKVAVWVIFFKLIKKPLFTQNPQIASHPTQSKFQSPYYYFKALSLMCFRPCLALWSHPLLLSPSSSLSQLHRRPPFPETLRARVHVGTFNFAVSSPWDFMLCPPDEAQQKHIYA